MSDQTQILLVEDSQDNIRLAVKIIEHLKFSVDIAEDGQQALDHCETHLPQLILMDVSLPGIDGLEVTSRLRKKPEFANTPIIAITAHAMVGFKEKALEAGCTDYLSKPFLPKDLIAVVSKYMEV